MPALFATGMVAGFVDAIAGGGGLLTVPALLWAGLPPQVALGTNKLQSSCGTALATWNYTRAGLLRWRALAAGLATTFAAAFAGAWAVSHVDATSLRRIIPGVLLLVAGYTALNPDLGRRAGKARMGAAAFAALFGTVLGFYDGFLGPGTGSFWMMAWVLVLGLDLRSATGHTKAMNLASNLAALAWFAGTSRVDYAVGAVMASGQLVGANLGSRLAIRRGAQVIRPVFLAMVTAIALKLLWDAFQRG